MGRVMVVAALLELSVLVQAAAGGPSPRPSTSPRPTPSASAASAADLAEVGEAIQAAHAGKTPGRIVLGSTNAGDFLVLVGGPKARVAMLAEAAEKQYRPYSIQDGLRDFAMDKSFMVYAGPASPKFQSGEWVTTPIPKEVLLQPMGVRDPSRTVRAMSNEVSPTSWTNSMGARFEGASITARFKPEALAAFASSEPVEIVILTSGDEKRYILNAARTVVR